MEDPNMPHFAELSSATVTWPICGCSNFWGPQPWLLALCQSVAVTQCFIVDDKNKKLVPLCDLFNTGTGFVAELQNKSRENPVFTWRDWHTFYLFEETKNQLDTLTSDIKGNANVVRTKLKCEWNCPFFGTCGRLKLSAVFLWHHNSVSTAMEQSMPKDDEANRCTVDFRIQKTQVSKHGADHSYTSHPPAKWKWLLQR